MCSPFVHRLSRRPICVQYAITMWKYTFLKVYEVIIQVGEFTPNGISGCSRAILYTTFLKNVVYEIGFHLYHIS